MTVPHRPGDGESLLARSTRRPLDGAFVALLIVQRRMPFCPSASVASPKSGVTLIPAGKLPPGWSAAS